MCPRSSGVEAWFSAGDNVWTWWKQTLGCGTQQPETVLGAGPRTVCWSCFSLCVCVCLPPPRSFPPSGDQAPLPCAHCHWCTSIHYEQQTTDWETSCIQEPRKALSKIPSMSSFEQRVFLSLDLSLLRNTAIWRSLSRKEKPWRRRLATNRYIFP